MNLNIGQEFIEKTKRKYREKSDHHKGVPQPHIELEYDKSKPLIDLPHPKTIKFGDINLRDTIENRRSVRTYSEQHLTLEELSWLLWCTQGVKKIIGRGSDWLSKGLDSGVTLRTVPGGGARHPFETYLLVKRVKDLEPGLYRFIATRHKLIEISLEEDLNERVTEACLGMSWVCSCAVYFLWTVVPYRYVWHYGVRSYRYFLMDAGHVCQNLYLAAEAVGCGVCAIGSFDDDEINSVLGIDGIEQFVIYCATVGKKKTHEVYPSN